MKNPELLTLFSWCTHLLQLPVLPLFVFDGNGRPKLKRGKAVRGNPHWIIRDMKTMLDAFGFAWVDVSVVVCILTSLTFTPGTWRG
jgi:Holliday junction resolvase YEN1